MYITIDNIKGEKKIDLSYSIQNFDSSKEIAVIRMLSDNVKYEILKLRAVIDPISDTKKMIPSGTYAGRELLSIAEGMVELNLLNLSFNIELTSTIDANRTLVSNIGRAIIKKLAVKFEGNEIMSIDDFDVFACYRDLWKTKSEKRNAIQQGIISTDRCMENCIKLRINAGDKNTGNTQDKAIADVYGNKFIIPLDLEMLDSAALYYQAGFGNRLCYEITFNNYN